jgi:hypothetical protein
LRYLHFKQEHQHLSPLFNLFAKKLGNIYEQYKLAECACEHLIESLGEARRAEQKRISNLREQFSKSAYQKVKLESELQASQIELNTLKADLEAPKSRFLNKRKFVRNDECQSTASPEKQPHRAAPKLEDILNKKCNASYSSQVALPKSRWLPLEVASSIQLDTAQIAREIKHILHKTSITYDKFAREVANINRVELTMLIFKPKPWTECNESRKRVYIKMHKWSQLADEMRSMSHSEKDQSNSLKFKKINLSIAKKAI